MIVNWMTLLMMAQAGWGHNQSYSKGRNPPLMKRRHIWGWYTPTHHTYHQSVIDWWCTWYAWCVKGGYKTWNMERNGIWNGYGTKH